MIDSQTVYVDDSGTDRKSRIAAAGCCVSTADRWQAFVNSWQKIATYAGFELKNFHMTEFAACRREHLCQQCRNGHTSHLEHPWQRWSEIKRKNVLGRMARELVKHVECGWGMAHTKEEYETHILASPARGLAGAPVADSHYTFAVQRCGGAFAQWRAASGRRDRLRFVFDLASPGERDEIANKFFAGIKDAERIQNGIEQWFEPEPDGVSFESRRKTHQLLAADMLAWTVATVRARQVFFGKGRLAEVLWLAKAFVNTEHIKIGYLAKSTLAEWEGNLLNAS